MPDGDGMAAPSRSLPGWNDHPGTRPGRTRRLRPGQPPRTGGYFWAVYSSFEIYSARPDGSDLKRLTDSPGYDAEATVSADGKKILFTSVRDGDLDLYVMNTDGSEPTRLTRTLGYDGGGFFSADGKMICFRASRPRASVNLTPRAWHRPAPPSTVALPPRPMMISWHPCSMAQATSWPAP